MKLLEYQVDQFYKDCKYLDTKSHECAKKGFRLGQQMYLKSDMWLNEKDCTDKDFIKAVYEDNFKTGKYSETGLLEILARFLCGYDKQVDSITEYESLPENKRINFFINKRLDLELTDEEISNKIEFIKKVLYS